MSQNRLWNCKNPYQGKAKKVLCVCSAGLLRSPTAAKILWREFGHNTRAAGIDTGHALIPVDDVLCAWADEIVVMSRGQQITLEDKFKVPSERIICLDIEDSFAYMDETLQSEIVKKYKNLTGAK